MCAAVEKDERNAVRPWPNPRPWSPKLGFGSTAIQKLHGGNVLIHGLWGELALIEQVELILPDGLDIEFCGASAEVLGKTGHVRDILPLCAGCEIAQLGASSRSACKSLMANN
jgi:hypothetical protein